jgi:hypothetical protein
MLGSWGENRDGREREEARIFSRFGLGEEAEEANSRGR